MSSAKRHGGDMEQYLPIHTLMDSSKSALADNRHRVLTHNAWFVSNVLPKVFGDYLIVPTTEEGIQAQAEIDSLQSQIDTIRETMRTKKLARVVAVTQIGEDHNLEDFGGKFIPTVQDYIVDGEMQLKEWMNNGVKGVPPSVKGMMNYRNVD